MELVHVLLLLSIANTALAAGPASCAYFDATGTVVSSFSPKGSHKLSCATGNIIQAGTSASFNFFGCSGGVWFGLSCDGTALQIGAYTLNVTCPVNPDIRSCPFVGSSVGFPPAVKVVNGVQVRMCGVEEELNVEGLSEGYTKATCMPDGNWAVFNCDGELSIVEEPLEANCGAIPATGCIKSIAWDLSECETLLAERTYYDGCIPAIIEESEVSCENGTALFVYGNGTEDPWPYGASALSCDSASSMYQLVFSDGSSSPASEVEWAIGQPPFKVACMKQACEPLWAMSPDECSRKYRGECTPATITRTEASCPQGKMMMTMFSGTVSDMKCEGKDWHFIDNEEGRGYYLYEDLRNANIGVACFNI